MIKLPQQAELHRLLDYNPHTGIFIWRTRGDSGWDTRFAGREAFPCTYNGYRVGSLCGRRCVSAHRVAYKYYHGSDPAGEIDHINGNRADNRISNLRDVTPQENRKNASIPSHNTSGAIGVAFVKAKGRWRAGITINNKPKYIGYYSSRDEAIAARKAVEKALGYHANHGRPRCI